MLREQNPAKKPSFDAIVANPPFICRWEPTDALADDVLFKKPRPLTQPTRRWR